MKKLFSRLKLETRGSVALLKDDQKRKSEMYDNLQRMIQEYDNSQTENKKSVFGMKLSEDPEGIPQFLFAAIEFIEKHGLETVGIFRHSTSKSKEEKAMKEIDEGFNGGGAKLATIDFEKYKDVHLAASLIKLFFRKLHEPLLTTKLYDSFLATVKMTTPRNRSNSCMSTDSSDSGNINSPATPSTPTITSEREEENKRIELLRKVITLLPKGNAVLLKRLCLFLHTITLHQKHNLMSPENISVVFQPNILYIKDQDPMETLRDISSCTIVVKTLIIHALEIFKEETEEQDSQPKEEPSAEKPVKVIHLHSFFANLLSQSFKEGLAYYKGSTNSDGEKHGFGMLMMPSGAIYEGNFKRNKRNGNGKMIFGDGSKYEGEFLDDFITGKGNYKYANGDHYEGEFLNGAKHGKGKIRYADNNSSYDGEWANDKRQGFGIIHYSNGDIYEGEWKDDKSSGFGTFNSQTYKYEGYWTEGKFHGRGKLYLLDTKEIFEGEMFEQGQFHGNSLYTDQKGRKFEQVYDKGELVKSERIIDENEKKILFVIQQLKTNERLRNHKVIEEILQKSIQNEDKATVGEEEDEVLRHSLYITQNNPETALVFELLFSTVELLQDK
ncbi:hypothetical protein ABK040_011509 [Willaertia magna]